MTKPETRFEGIYKKIDILKTFLRIMGVKPHFFAITALLSFLVAALDGLSVGLLIPLAKGVIARDFTFLKNVPVFETVIARFPNLFAGAPAKFMFILLVTIIFTAAIAKNAFKYLAAVYNAAKREMFSLRLKQFIFDRFLSFGKMFFDRTSQGHIGSAIGFAEQMSSLFGILNSALISVFTLLVYLGIMLAISWKLSIFALMIFPVFHYSVGWIVSKIRKTAALQTETVLKLSREVFNILSCMALVKAYDKEDEAKKKYTDLNEELRRWNLSLAKKRDLIAPIQEIITLVSLVVLISVVAYIFLKTHTTDISRFLILLYILRRSVPILGSFNNIRASLATLEAPIEKVAAVLDDNDKFFVPSGKRIFDGLKEGIRFKNMNFSYTDDVSVLKDVDLFLEKGKMTAIVGPTGAGKTTLINLIMRFYDCPPATVFLDNIDIREFALKSLKKHKALVSQDAILLNDTLRNNIAFGMSTRVSDEKIIDVVKKAQLYDFVMGLPDGLNTEVGDRGVKLSGGEKQRVAIARALLKGADILILDEATSSLDTKTEKEIQKAIEEAAKGRTMIVIAHRLSTIKNADKIAVVENGKFLEEGTLTELLERRGKFYRYWEEQKFY